MVSFLNKLKSSINNKITKIKNFIAKIKGFSIKKLFTMPNISDGIIDFIAHFWHRLTLILICIIVLYYPIGASFTHKIDDNTHFSGVVENSKSSQTVATVANLIKREVDDYGWTANLPFFFPSFVLDNMPEYQMGIVSALSRFSMELTDQLGRSRGSSEADKDLEAAAGLLKYSGKIWIIDSTSSYMPTASANKQYRTARKKLLAYNSRLAKGQAVFEKRADNLQMTLDRIAKDLGSVSETIDKQIDVGEEKFIDLYADNVFYSTKGKIYAYYLILRDLGKDFESILEDKELKANWDRMLESFIEAAKLQPYVITNGHADSQILPSHLASMGFYLLRARTQLNEASSILLK
jgi:hypothetical protein